MRCFMKYYLIVLGVLFLQSTSCAQSLLEIDTHTYQLFFSGKYDSLKLIGNEAIKNGNDFYFLRMRLGIVYYSEKNYEAALTHFAKAYQFNDVDSVLQEYLYYSYLFTNQQEYATILLSKCSEEIQKKLAYRPSGLLKITLGSGLSFTQNDEHFAQNDILQHQQYAEGYFSGDVVFGNLDLQSIHNKRIKMFHSFQIFNSTSLGRVESPKFRFSEKTPNLNLQYNAGISWAFSRGWKAYFAAGFYRQSYSIYQFVSFSPSLPDTVSKTKLFYQNFFDDYFSGTLGAGKRFRYVAPFLGIAIANFNKQTLLQAEVALTYYPLGNAHLYGTTTGAIITQNSKNQLVISQTIGGKIITQLWYEISGSYGNHQNYLAKMGFLTYNTFGNIQLAGGVDLKYYHKRLVVNPLYRFNLRKGTYTQISKNQITQQQKFNFNNHIFSILLSWNF